MPKRNLGINVHDAAMERIKWTFDNFQKIYVSFSAGKDSTAMIHLVMTEAIARGRRIGVMFIDWECQATHTINAARHIYEMYADNIDPYWVALPMTTWNGCSQIETEWTAWDQGKRDLWVRQPDKLSITDESFFPFYYKGMTFEEFVPLFGKWYANGDECAAFVGIRADESLNRFRAVLPRDNKEIRGGKPYTTRVVDGVWNVYPIYDWQTADIWRYFAKFNKPYNVLYDRMHQAGVKLSQMRICEPFGDTQRQGLWLYQVIEPEMWAKLCLRVSGANTGALYAHEKGAVLGNGAISLPEGQTWQGFVAQIINTMPDKTATHYKNKIAVYIKWWSKKGYPDGIMDSADKSLEAKGKVPTWRKIAKTILRNDYWCKGMGFSPTKSTAYQKYLSLMERRRNEWGIYADKDPT